MALSSLTRPTQRRQITMVRVTKQLSALLRQISSSHMMSIAEFGDTFLLPHLEKEYKAKILAEAQRLKGSDNERRRSK